MADSGGTLAVIVAARNEAEWIGATLKVLRETFPAATSLVADDASTDGTAEVAITAGAQVVSRRRPHGKGANVLRSVLPLAAGFGLETGMTIDAARAGSRIREIELALEHRATGRTPRAFAHRARQLLDSARAYLARR